MPEDIIPEDKMPDNAHLNPYPHPKPHTNGLLPHPKPHTNGLLPHPKPHTNGLLPHPKPHTNGLLPHPKPHTNGLLPQNYQLLELPIRLVEIPNWLETLIRIARNYQHSELPIFGIFNRNTGREPGYGLRYGLG